MIRKILYALWGVFFSLCAGLGFIPEPEGMMADLLTAMALLSFLPPFALLYQAAKTGNRHDSLLVRNLAGLSLGGTLALLILNFLCAFGSETLGRILHYVLIIVSSPMVCSGHWAASLFLWACLLMVSAKQTKR